ncbi:uncharacterized protein METZ01_LOCUS80265 [marine metagenome]|uniref:Uncharacterized protein n=1 Tax=marine metagenome TaxID=408172 RepID=A0A381UI93_9ZZZZ
MFHKISKYYSKYPFFNFPSNPSLLKTFNLGEHEIQRRAGDFLRGVYFALLESREFVDTKNMVLLK